MDNTPDLAVVSVKDNLPPVGCHVIVVCKDFRCLGYLDHDSVWRDAAHQTELQNVIGWLPL